MFFCVWCFKRLAQIVVNVIHDEFDERARMMGSVEEDDALFLASHAAFLPISQVLAPRALLKVLDRVLDLVVTLLASFLALVFAQLEEVAPVEHLVEFVVFVQQYTVAYHI